MNSGASDVHPIETFTNTKFYDLHEDAFAYLMDPPLEWANLKDCGNFPCTGPQNIVLYFKNTQFFGSVLPD